LSGLDPSMLVGFLCQTEEDWEDLCHRLKEVGRLHTAIVHIADRPPHWFRSVSATSSTRAGSSSRKPSNALQPDVSDIVEHDALDSDVSVGVQSFDEPDDWDLSSEGEKEGFSPPPPPPCSSPAEISLVDRGEAEPDPVGQVRPSLEPISDAASSADDVWVEASGNGNSSIQSASTSSPLLEAEDDLLPILPAKDLPPLADDMVESLLVTRHSGEETPRGQTFGEGPTESFINIEQSPQILSDSSLLDDF